MAGDTIVASDDTPAGSTSMNVADTTATVSGTTAATGTATTTQTTTTNETTTTNTASTVSKGAATITVRTLPSCASVCCGESL